MLCHTLAMHGKDIPQNTLEEKQSAEEGGQVIKKDGVQKDDAGKKVCCEETRKESRAALSEPRRQYVGVIGQIKKEVEESHGQEEVGRQEAQQEEVEEESCAEDPLRSGSHSVTIAS
jgi:hypothetical protein